MRMMRVCLVGVLALFLASCGSDKPKDLIVGKWKGKEKMPDGKEVDVKVEFTKDGTVKMTQGDLTIDGKYKFVDDNNIEMEATILGQTQKQKMKVEVTKDKLKTTDEKGDVDEFTRDK